ncbi:MAG TPA: hypothetical protein VJU77_06780 [Chthoniobacterales bacterium]|nr:hypothetical protein [Chthoniobacterales bacterium]
MPTRDTVLQIVPRLPGTFDGVGDHALNLAKALSANHGITTTFLVAEKTAVESKEGYAVISGIDSNSPVELARKYAHVILHYVNYGYQPRGVPFKLRSFVRKLRGELGGRWVTTFHEIYASGPPWKSAFWLRPFQVKIARDLIDASTACVVSNAPIEKVIHAYDAEKKVYLLPIMSNFGEPDLDDFEAASPARWVICGGTALIARSLGWFEEMQALIPKSFAPEQLEIVGGREDISIRTTLERLSRGQPGLSCQYYPEIAPQAASEILRRSCFALLDYFGAGKVWPGMVLKSSVFAGLCAHGIVPILSHQEKAISINGDPLPGPYYLTPGATSFPAPEELHEIQRRIYRWYHAHAHSRRLAEAYAEALR